MAARRRVAENWDSEGQSENDNVESSELEDDGSHASSRKRRHTPNQIQTMEEFFRDCPHPNEKERKSLSQALGLNPLQVKFWFQNKRTQLKAQQKRMENTFLKTQNDKLRAENKSLREAVSNVTCLKCDMPCGLGGMSAPLDKLKAENARLKMELQSLQIVAKNIVDKSIGNDHRFTAPLVAPRSLDLDLELGGSSFGGPLISNSGEGLIFAGNMHFNVAHLTPFEEQVTFQQRMETAFWTPTFTDDFIKTKKPRFF